MQLLRDSVLFKRLRLHAAVRRNPLPRDYTITVPAPLTDDTNVVALRRPVSGTAASAAALAPATRTLPPLAWAANQ